MNIEGKWNVRYAARQDSNFPNETGDPEESGEITLKAGRITGSDPFGASYEGTYSLKATRLEARVRVSSDEIEQPFIFEDVPNPFELRLKGNFTSDDYFSARGKVVENPKLEIVVNCSRIKKSASQTTESPVMKTTPTKHSRPFGRSNRELVPPSTFSVQALKDLFAVMGEISSNAADIEISTLHRREDQSVPNFEKMKQHASELCRLRVYLTSTDGDMFSSYDDSIFSNPNVPTDLKTIVFDSSSDFQIQVNRRPQNWTRLELDLSKPRILDLNLSPSEPTPNGSNLTVEGSDSNWANLSLQKIRTILKQSRSNRALLHTRNFFDLYVFLFTAPITFLIISKLEASLQSLISQLTPFQYFFIFAYFFLVVANILRIFFNYTRSVFPYIEFDSGRVNRGLTRIAWSTISVALLGGLAWSLVSLLWTWLVS